MSSLITKLTRRRSTAATKPPARPTRKAASKKQPHKKRIAVEKSKKVNLTQASKKSGSVKTAKATTKSATAKSQRAKKHVKPRASKAAAPKAGRAKLVATSRKTAASRTARTAQKPIKRKTGASAANSSKRVQRSRPAPKIETEVKKPPSPKTIAGIRAFESALKSFNRQDFVGAKVSFESILTQFGDQTDIVSPVRTYLAICDQKLARSAGPARGLEPLYNQGVFEFNRGNTQLAIAAFEKALKLEPKADHVLYSLATAYTKAGNRNKALESLRRAIALRPVHRYHSRHDPDFVSLKDDPDFQHLSGLDMELS